MRFLSTRPSKQILAEGQQTASADQLAAGPIDAQMSEHSAAWPARPALLSPTFLFYQAGSFLSWTGDWMDWATLNWAVFQLTGSALDLGLMNACRLIPVFALSLPAGVLADRFDRRRMLMMLQSAMMVLTFGLGALVLCSAPFWLFVVTATARAVLGAMVVPIRDAMLPNLVPPRAVASAVASQAAIMNIARTVGLALAAALLMVLPLPALFWINGASFLVVLFTLFVVRPRRSAAPPPRSAEPFREAFLYIKRNAAIKSLLLLAVVPMVFGFPYQTMMPVFARDLLHGGIGEGGYGLLLTLAAAGSLAGALWLSVAGRMIQRAGCWLVLSVLGFGLSLILFTLSHVYVLAAILAFAIGLMSQLYRTMSRITIQMQAPDHLRGRILSIALMDRGFIPLGAILIGAVAEWGGTMMAGIMMGAGCIGITLLVLYHRRQVWTIDLASDVRRRATA